MIRAIENQSPTDIRSNDEQASFILQFTQRSIQHRLRSTAAQLDSLIEIAIRWNKILSTNLNKKDITAE
jgi:hypothetical protein